MNNGHSHTVPIASTGACEQAGNTISSTLGGADRAVCLPEAGGSADAVPPVVALTESDQRPITMDYGAARPRA